MSLAPSERRLVCVAESTNPTIRLTTPNAGLFYIRKKLIATDNSCPGQKKFEEEPKAPKAASLNFVGADVDVQQRLCHRCI